MQTIPFYITGLGSAFQGDSRQLLLELEPESVDLIMTSPPFALQRKKAYGNEDQSDYVDWLLGFADGIMRALKPSGSLVLDLGGAYQKGIPVRSLYNFRVLLRMCDEFGFYLAEEFFWHNPSKLPSPIEWVNKRKIRAKDSVNTVWWLSKTPNPKADITRVLTPFSERMKKLMKDPEKYYTPKVRPSGHDISNSFGKGSAEGALPSNLLSIPNSESSSFYIKMCKALDLETHPARFPIRLPKFFIEMLTDPGDVVLDIFAGSNTTGRAAEDLDRKWLAFELSEEYLATSALRFLPNESLERCASVIRLLRSGVSTGLELVDSPVLL